MEFLAIDVMADPDVKRASDRLQGFNGDLVETERQISEMNSTVVSLGKGKHRGPIDRAADALVGGKNFEDIEGDVAVLQGEYPKLCKRRAVVARAIELQKKVIVKEEERASREICTKLEPDYRANVAALAKHMIALGKAMVVDITFFDDLRSGGVRHGSLMGMRVTALGDPRDRNSRLAMWLMEALAFGLIDEATVPAEWRERWAR